MATAHVGAGIQAHIVEAKLIDGELVPESVACGAGTQNGMKRGQHGCTQVSEIHAVAEVVNDDYRAFREARISAFGQALENVAGQGVCERCVKSLNASIKRLTKMNGK